MGGPVILNRASKPAPSGPVLTPGQKAARRITAALSIFVSEGNGDTPDAEAIRNVAGLVESGAALPPETAFALAAQLRTATESKSAAAREAALLGVLALTTLAGRAAEPSLVPLLPVLLDLTADKVRAREGSRARWPCMQGPEVPCANLGMNLLGRRTRAPPSLQCNRFGFRAFLTSFAPLSLAPPRARPCARRLRRRAAPSSPC